MEGIKRTDAYTPVRFQFFNIGGRDKRVSNVTSEQPMKIAAFAKLLLKIGYCYAAAERGINTFDGDAIRNLLSGQRDDIYTFVGNVSKPEILANHHLHGLYFREKFGFLTVLIHLFASCVSDGKGPVVPYEVVVGKIR